MTARFVWPAHFDVIADPVWEQPERFEQFCMRDACYGLSLLALGDERDEVARIESLALAGCHPETRLVARLSGRGRPPATVAADIWDRTTGRELAASPATGRAVERRAAGPVLLCLAVAHFDLPELTSPVARVSAGDPDTPGHVGDLHPLPGPPSEHPKLYEQSCLREILLLLSGYPIRGSEDVLYALWEVGLTGEPPHTKITVERSRAEGAREVVSWAIWREHRRGEPPSPTQAGEAMFARLMGDKA